MEREPQVASQLYDNSNNANDIDKEPWDHSSFPHDDSEKDLT